MSIEPARRTRREAPFAATAAPTESFAERLRWLAVALAVFVSGAVLLGMEIAASRVLAPFFGNSLFVWGALIGVVLTGLAIGYWVGGALADRFPVTPLLVGVMALGAVLVLAVPLVDGPVLEGLVRWNAGPRLNPVLAAAALFGAPSVVLAATSPVAVRLTARSLTSVGRTAGRLFAVSTAGSIVGTFAVAFFLLPELGTAQLLAFAAAAQLGGATLVGLAGRAWLASFVTAATAVAAVTLALSLAPATTGRLAGVAAENWSPLYRLRGEHSTTDYAAEGYDVIFRRDTRYHALAVVEDDDSRYLRFDNSFQSAMYLDRPFATRYAYTDYFDLGLAYNPRAEDVLFVGLGGGSAPKRMWRDFPDLALRAVELDPVVVDVAFRYFELPRSPRLDVQVEDGRRYLERDRSRWGVIALDAFYSDSVPFHLTTREFVDVVRSRLEPGGVVVSNVIGALEGPNSKLLRSLVRTFRTSFPTVVVHPVNESGDTPETVQNVIVVATERPAPNTDFLVERWQQLRARRPSAPDLTRAIRGRYERPFRLDDVPTLTDDYAPTDALLLVD